MAVTAGTKLGTYEIISLLVAEGLEVICDAC